MSKWSKHLGDMEVEVTCTASKNPRWLDLEGDKFNLSVSTDTGLEAGQKYKVRASYYVEMMP